MKHTPDRQMVAAATPTIQVARTIAAFPDWPRAGRPGRARCFAHQSADVLSVWCDTIGPARGIEPLFVRMTGHSGQAALFLPFGLQRVRGVTVLQFLDGGVSDYNAPVLFPETPELGNGARIWNALRPHLPPFDLAILEKMPAAVQGLSNPLFELATKARHESCHVVNLYGPPEHFARERFPNAADSRRRLRKLQALGAVRFEIADTDEQRELFLEAMIRQKRQRFLDTKGFDAFATLGTVDFYRQATKRLGRTGPVQLSALRLDDRILAAHWGYVDGDRFYQLMPSHEAGEWRFYAPGRLLNEWLIQWSIAQGLVCFDFGIGDEPYKFDYCDLHVPLGDAVLPMTPKGRAYAVAHNLKTAAKDTLRDTRLGAALLGARKRWHTARRNGGSNKR